MNNKYTQFAVRRTALIVSSALLALCAVSANAKPTEVEESEITALTHPKSTVEAGVGGVTGTSWKYGQYNALDKSGFFGIGIFDIRGGGAYDSDNATRWRITGTNIGLENRNFTGEYKNQGKYKLNFGYDELPMYRNNTYQTPYLGAGGANLTLPANWLYPPGLSANGRPNMRTLPAVDLANFHNVNIGTKRDKLNAGFSYFLTPQLEALASMSHETKNGTQTLGAPIIVAQSVILPNPIDQITDQINASLKYTGEKGFGQFAYYGSLFHNNVDSVNFQNPFAAGLPTFGRMSSMPDNQFHQFSLSGGYNFTPATKLVLNGAYARNWQNQTFLPYSTQAGGGGVLPVGSLGGDVETKSVNVKLTHRVNKDLNLSSAYKYDERENNTPINIYNFADVDNRIGGAGSFNNFRNNTPFSKRVQQGNLDADYSFAKGHWVKLGYEIQNIDRWCNGSWISCVDTGTTTENTGKIDYRGNWFEKLSSKLGYAYSYRSADNYNQDNAAFASFPIANAGLLNQINNTGLSAWGPALPYAVGNAALIPGVFPNNNPATTGNLVNNAIDIDGLGRFNTAARERQKARAYFDYQVTDKFTVGLGGDYRHDNYPTSTFGLQSSQNWGINLDGGYTFNEDTSVQLFYSYQDIHSKSDGMSYASYTPATINASTTTANRVIGGCLSPNNTVRTMNSTSKTDPCRNWSTNQADNVDTIGFGVKHKGFFNGKLDLNGDFLYSFARTLVGVAGGQYVQSPLAGNTATNGRFLYISAANMPEVKTQTFQFKLDAKYTINKPSAIHLTYMYARMLSSDYVYTGMQQAPGGTPTSVMPTNEQAPQYSINVIGLSYIYNF